MSKKVDAFALFTTEPKTAVIKALGDVEITYRELSMLENDKFAERMVKGYGGEDGLTPQMDYKEATKIKYEKVSAMLLDPKKTVEELEAMGSSAQAAFTEILALGGEKDMVDEEGNSED